MMMTMMNMISMEAVDSGVFLRDYHKSQTNNLNRT